MKSEEDIKEMIKTNLVAIEAYLEEIGDALSMLKKNPSDTKFKTHIVEQLFAVSLDAGAVGALQWVLEMVKKE